MSDLPYSVRIAANGARLCAFRTEWAADRYMREADLNPDHYHVQDDTEQGLRTTTNMTPASPLAKEVVRKG